MSKLTRPPSRQGKSMNENKEDVTNPTESTCLQVGVERIVSWIINDFKRTNFRKCLRFAVAMIISPALIPVTILSLVVTGIAEGLGDDPMDMDFYIDYHFNGMLGWFKVWS